MEDLKVNIPEEDNGKHKNTEQKQETIVVPFRKKKPILENEKLLKKEIHRLEERIKKDIEAQQIIENMRLSYGTPKEDLKVNIVNLAGSLKSDEQKLEKLKNIYLSKKEDSKKKSIFKKIINFLF